MEFELLNLFHWVPFFKKNLKQNGSNGAIKEKNLKIHIKKSPKHFNYSKIYLKYLPIWQYVKGIL
jgi:hypothetical protein